jgi:Cu-Zn family superoxide dismutase
MRRIITAAVGVAALASLLPMGAHAATAALKSPDGSDMGTLNFVQTADGVRITGKVRGLEPGEHAFHIHAVGKCDAPDFKSAGGHYNPYNSPHGKQGGGPHAGDMDNIAVVDSGPVEISVVNSAVTLNAPAKGTLFDADGSAIVFHAGPDDYASQPAGAAGGRVACGIIQ